MKKIMFLIAFFATIFNATAINVPTHIEPYTTTYGKNFDTPTQLAAPPQIGVVFIALRKEREFWRLAVNNFATGELTANSAQSSPTEKARYRAAGELLSGGETLSKFIGAFVTISTLTNITDDTSNQSEFEQSVSSNWNNWYP